MQEFMYGSKKIQKGNVLFMKLSSIIKRVFAGFVFSCNYKVTVKYSRFCKKELFLQI